jgi:agmatine deiminase
MQREVVYVSDLLPLRFASFFQDLNKALQTAGIECRLLPGAKDVWVRDFMPVQTVLDRFVQFIYNPDYLQKQARWRRTISDPASICAAIGIKTEKANLVLDGGNLERFAAKAILTDKVFLENPSHSEDSICRDLAHLLGLEQVIIIPQEPGDMLGHVDGLVRFLDDETVLVNDYTSESQRPFCAVQQQVLHAAGLLTIQIPYAAGVDQNLFRLSI